MSSNYLSLISAASRLDARPHITPTIRMTASTASTTLKKYQREFDVDKSSHTCLKVSGGVNYNHKNGKN